jgi:hypothetical protein
MNVFYIDSKQSTLDKPSIFLAGPTPRDKETPSWRPEAIRLFNTFDGDVFVPERSNGEIKFEYYDQVEWEWKHLHAATVILFWVPRNLQNMPAFTTNVEFGYYLATKPNACFYGRPENSPKTRYLDWLYKQVVGEEPITELSKLVYNIVENIDDIH